MRGRRAGQRHLARALFALLIARALLFLLATQRLHLAVDVRHHDAHRLRVGVSVGEGVKVGGWVCERVWVGVLVWVCGWVRVCVSVCACVWRATHFQAGQRRTCSTDERIWWAGESICSLSDGKCCVMRVGLARASASRNAPIFFTPVLVAVRFIPAMSLSSSAGRPVRRARAQISAAKLAMWSLFTTALRRAAERLQREAPPPPWRRGGRTVRVWG